MLIVREILATVVAPIAQSIDLKAYVVTTKLVDVAFARYRSVACN